MGTKCILRWFVDSGFIADAVYTPSFLCRIREICTKKPEQLSNKNGSRTTMMPKGILNDTSIFTFSGNTITVGSSEE
ncbi:MAG: hypothetical protein ACI4I9_02580 [Porcipelethomonas sp.]